MDDTPEPPTDDAEVPATGDPQTPATGDVHPPTSGDAQEPATGDAQERATGEVQVPTADEAPTAGAEDALVPAADEVQVPAAGEAQLPAAGDTPITGDAPVTGDAQTPAIGDALVPATGGALTLAADDAETRPKRGHHYRGHHRRLRRWPRRVLILANVVVLLLIASSATAVGYLAYEYKQIKRVSVSDLTPTTTTESTTIVIRNHRRVVVKVKPKHKVKPPFTVLIIGSDSRADASKLGVNVGNEASQSENLSDAIILARVSPSTHQVALLSIPRDLEVNVPGMGETKINAAFSGGDPSRLVEVIQKELGIPVNHYAALNFLAVEEIARAIGGVEQYFPTPAKDVYSNLLIPKAGCVNLTGAQALAFVRSRHYEYFLNGQWQYQQEPESDLGRIQRQQAFIRDAVEKVERTGALNDPLTLRGIISSVAKNLTLDKTFSVSDLLSLADDFRHIDATKIPSVTLSATNAVQDGADVLLPSPAADKAEIKAFLATGTPKVKKKATKPKTTTTSASTTTTTVPTTTTTAPVDGSPYQSATAIIPSSSSYTKSGVYIPPGRVPGQKIDTCGN